MTALPVHALGRLLWRPLTLWNLFLVVAICWALGRLAYVAGGGADNLVDADALQRLHSERLFAGLVPVLLPAGLGVVTGWALWDLLLSPFSFALPGLRAALARALPAAGVLCGLGTWALARALEAGRQQGLGPLWLGAPASAITACEALLWFAVGVAAMDPLLRARAWLRWLLYLLFAARVLGAAPAAVALSEHALVAGPLAAVAGLFVLWKLLAMHDLRVRASSSSIGADRAYHAADLRFGWSGASAARLQHAAETADERPVPFARGAVRSTGDWVRATFFEHFGWGHSGWMGGVCRGVATIGLLLVTAVAMVGRGDRDDGYASLAQLVRSMLHGDGSAPGASLFASGMLPNVLGVLVSLFIVYSPFLLAAPARAPISRRRLAEVAWRTSLVQGVGILVIIAALVGIAGLAAAYLAGPPEVELTAAPLVRTLAGLAMVLPFAQWCRLRFLDAHGRRPGPWQQAAAGGLACIVLVLGNQLLVNWWEHQPWLPALAAQVGLMLAVAVAVQLAWRAVLVRHFRRATLA